MNKGRPGKTKPGLKLVGYGGNDSIKGGSFDDTLIGGSGDDWIRTSLEWGHSHPEGIDIVRGGPGNDNLEGRHNSDFISGGDGDDFIVGGIGTDTLNGGKGNDKIMDVGSYWDIEHEFWQKMIQPSRPTLSGGDGDDTIDVFVSPAATLLGGSGDDLLTVTSTSSDEILVDGGIGNDRLEISGDGGSLVGGDGNDHIIGGFRVNTFVGGAGDDLLESLTGLSVMTGGEGDDIFSIVEKRSPHTHGGTFHYTWMDRLPNSITDGYQVDGSKSGLPVTINDFGNGNDVVRIAGDDCWGLHCDFDLKQVGSNVHVQQYKGSDTANYFTRTTYSGDKIDVAIVVGANIDELYITGQEISMVGI